MLRPNVHYSARTQSVFEIIATYFVHAAVNVLPNSARALQNDKSGQFDSFTRAYAHTFNAWIRSFSDRTLYPRIIGAMHVWHMDKTKDQSMAFNDFTMLVVKQMVPPDYFNSMTTAQRDGVLQSTLRNVIAEFRGTKIGPAEIDAFASGNVTQDIVVSLKDAFVSMLLAEKMKLETALTIYEASGGNVSVSEGRVLSKLKAQLVGIVRENVMLKARVEKLAKQLDAHDDDDRKHDENHDYKRKYEESAAANETLLARVAGLEVDLAAARGDIRQIALTASAPAPPRPRAPPRARPAPASASQPPLQPPLQPQLQPPRRDLDVFDGLGGLESYNDMPDNLFMDTYGTAPTLVDIN